MEQTQESANPFRVVVFADFVCPYSFLAVDQIDRLAREYDVKPLWRPYWLHPETPPEGTPCARPPEKVERLHAWIKEMAPEHYDRIRIPEKRQYSFHAFRRSRFSGVRAHGSPSGGVSGCSQYGRHSGFTSYSRARRSIWSTAR